MSMRTCTRLAAAIAFVIALPIDARASQAWCTMSFDGAPDCTYATLKDCEQSSLAPVECIPNPYGEVD